MVRTWNSLNEKVLAAQIRSQKRHRWDIDRDIDWGRGVDADKFLLPLDRDALFFPGASNDQRLVLSQLMGLIINSTIGEMEDAILKLRDVAWERLLRDYPVNPEMGELGDLFFEEEAKHSATFARYIDKFCEATGVPRDALDELMPKAFGSLFLRATLDNARKGGFVFWWAVAAVEEVSIEIHRHLHKHQGGIDPLYYAIHRRHLEEEARHRNYAFLMLDLIHRLPAGPLARLRQKADGLKAQALMTGWVVTELTRIFEARRVAHRHPFLGAVADCLPLFRRLSPREIVHKLFVSSPFVSLVLNPRHHRLVTKAASEFGIWTFPFPEPRIEPVSTSLFPRRGKAAA